MTDGDAIRHEGDRQIDRLTERLNRYRTLFESNVANSPTRYFDPAIQIRGQVANVQQELTRTFERFVGENSQFLALLSPMESNQLLAAMRATVNSVLQAETAAILAQFSLGDSASALSRLVRRVGEARTSITRELSLDKEGADGGEAP